ncbi:tRNA (adenosine(37)-N6)-threonylcarbamoyltransferase complex dimerization subunit type 1 TsaB [Desulfomicrobium baculatum]|uniref:Peptidase M22 glycoprotease n=1 Tax=Desulfomicrobium baculatum (strain DSM 4028 / VKM B-1378 / X) TaxID=525897 RepID=C7LR57_DESBD|nr:tRNA (adenosine(37)-N6)-threonylcarbamoyltransferase complex dimerization subunit type 1 TsaB [Desulfomicrobium baculatum]ACU90463.1 peptidase M22 glycoprotease [Desulfomicrobium baculatum DSM 4028]
MISSDTSSSRYLALNCAEERIQVVLGTAREVMFSEEVHCPGQSIRHLPTAIERALRVQAIRAGDLAGIACVRGPGSFTGLRIAHAAMHGLSRPHAIPMAGLHYPDILAAQAGPFAQGGELWVLTYARKGQVYIQGFDAGAPLTPVRPLPVALAYEQLEARPAGIFLLGSGLRKNPEFLTLPGTIALPQILDTPMPAALLAAACAAAYSSHPPQPLYLRKSDAEDNLVSIAASRGIPAAEARKHIPDFE